VETYVNVPLAPPRPRLGWVDAMRGIAALAVALFHGMLVLYVGVNAVAGHPASRFDRLASYLSWPTHYGYVGVMLFFVLSGFVIHLPYAGGKRSFAFNSYFVRRFLRIYPPYAAALVLSIVVATHIHVGRAFPVDIETLTRSFLFVQNYPHYGGAAGELAWLQPAGNLALWSLPVEFELYLVYPLLLLLMHRLSLTKAMLAIGAVSLLASLVDLFVAHPRGESTNWANYLPTFMHYWIVWSAGAWLAELLVTERLPRWNARWTVVFAAATLLALANRKPLLPNDFSDYVLMVVFVCAMVWLAANANVTARFHNSNPLVKLGDISYSLYLIHMPIFLTIEALWMHLHGGARPTNYLVSVAAVLAAIPIAYVFSLLFERPSIALGKRLGRILDRGRSRVPAPAAAETSA
jgi:peptidoglycan/LPS O-acetylase OafA/YrhL